MSSQRPRRTRRRRYQQSDPTKVELPGPLRVLTNPKVFVAAGIIFAAGMIIGILPGVGLGSGGSSQHDPLSQGNEITDAPPTAASGTPAASSTSEPTPAVKRYDAAPPLTIDTTKTYTATIVTTKGEIELELYAAEAPETVNSFVFLASQGYYDGTPFMLGAGADGSRFVAQAGDPTGTGLGTPGYSITKETTTRAFERGAIGMGGTSPTSNGGQFFISFGDYPALDGKYTIFGRIVSGLDVLDKLTLLDPANPQAGADAIVSVEISPAPSVD